VEALERLEALVAHLDLRADGLLLAPSASELEQLDLGGVLQTVAARLAEQGNRGGADGALAGAALTRLWQLTSARGAV
jgi:hypothetical protein